MFVAILVNLRKRVFSADNLIYNSAAKFMIQMTFMIFYCITEHNEFTLLQRLIALNENGIVNIVKILHEIFGII